MSCYLLALPVDQFRSGTLCPDCRTRAPLTKPVMTRAPIELTFSMKATPLARTLDYALKDPTDRAPRLGSRCFFSLSRGVRAPPSSLRYALPDPASVQAGYTTSSSSDRPSRTWRCCRVGHAKLGDVQTGSPDLNRPGS